MIKRASPGLHDKDRLKLYHLLYDTQVLALMYFQLAFICRVNSVERLQTVKFIISEKTEAKSVVIF